MMRLQRKTFSRRTVETLKAGKHTIFWDSQLTGFGIRVRKSGHKNGVVHTRAAGKLPKAGRSPSAAADRYSDRGRPLLWGPSLPLGAAAGTGRGQFLDSGGQMLGQILREGELKGFSHLGAAEIEGHVGPVRAAGDPAGRDLAVHVCAAHCSSSAFGGLSSA